VKLLHVLVALWLAKGAEHEGVDRWPVKTSVVRLDAQVTRVKLSDLLALPEVPGVKSHDGLPNGRYHEQRIQRPLKMSPEQTLHEGDLVATKGWLHLVAAEADGDYHIQISDSADSGDNCLIVEIPSPNAVHDPALRQKVKQARDYLRETVFTGHEPKAKGTLLKKPVFVRVTGQLFYDSAHAGSAKARGKQGMHATNLWELHPVTDIQLAQPGVPVAGAGAP